MLTGIYLRISDKSQNLDGQRAQMLQWMMRENVTDVEWYIDVQTGKNLKRPEFERLQQDIHLGKINTVAVWKLDRLARSMRDGINLIYDWLDRDIRVISLTQGYDWSGAVGRMVAGILFAFAEMELTVMKERQAAGIAAAKASGVYANHGRKQGETKANPARARELQMKGLSVREIGEALGVSEWTVRRYLSQ